MEIVNKEFLKNQNNVEYCDEFTIINDEKYQKVKYGSKLGYQALLRNCCNFLDVDVSNKHILKVAKRLSDEKEVLKSKQLPFRFWSAYKAIMPLYFKGHRTGPTIKHNVSKVNILSSALESAIKESVNNLQLFNREDDVLIASDVSGSMFSKISPKSEITNFDIGLVLSGILQSKCNFVETGIFGDSFKIINLNKDAVLESVKNMYSREGEVGYSTNGFKVLQHAQTLKNVDRICIFTDCQLWNSGYGDESMHSEWLKLKKKHPHCKIYLFNLAANGETSPLRVNSNDVFMISGWSDKIFEVLENLEAGISVLDNINNIKL